jgi:hypothetical protein
MIQCWRTAQETLHGKRATARAGFGRVYFANFAGDVIAAVDEIVPPV